MQHKIPEAFEHLALAVRTDPAFIDARVLDGRDPSLLDLLGGCYARQAA